MAILLPENAVLIVRGTSKVLNVTIKRKEGDPEDLTGGVLYFSVKRRAEDEHCLIQKTSVDVAQISIPNPTDGIAKIFLDPADTQNLQTRKYVFDIWLVNALSERFVVVKPSVFEVEGSVTVIPV